MVEVTRKIPQPFLGVTLLTLDELLPNIEKKLQGILENSSADTALRDMKRHLKALQIASGVQYSVFTWTIQSTRLSSGRRPHAYVLGNVYDLNQCERINWQGSRRKTRNKAKSVLNMTHVTLRVYAQHSQLQLKFLVSAKSSWPAYHEI